MDAEVTITLTLSEYEASGLNGALLEFAERWDEEDGGVSAICGQLPEGWELQRKPATWKSR